jgi:hypothetical protein
VKVCIARITRKQDSQIKERMYVCVAEILTYYPSEASRAQVRYRDRGKEFCDYNNSLRMVTFLVVASVCS